MSLNYREILEKEKQRILKQLKSDITDAVKKADLLTLKELKTEASKMYNKLITDYYTYKTLCYIRHGQSEPGTGTGENLYRANNIHIQGRELILGTDYKLMESGYDRHGRDKVLEMVKSGQRFAGRKHNSVPWRGNFMGNYITLNDTYINEAFEEFEDRFGEMYDKIFDEKMSQLSGKYEFY